MGEEDQDQVRILISTQHAEVGTCHLSVTKKNKTEFLDICLVAHCHWLAPGQRVSLSTKETQCFTASFLATSPSN